MPIAHTALPGPLRQGDILKGLELYMSTHDGAASEPVPFCVVLSRDCNALRSASIVVAEIHSYVPEEFKEIFSGSVGLDAARRRLDGLRDGDGTPDTCYLGPLLEGEVRYAVSLERIHTVEVPVGEGREKWVETHRAFQLALDFIRHLQIRLFSSVAKQGFDDFRWWPKQDLDSLVAVGKKELADLQATSEAAKLKLKQAEVEGAREKELAGRRGEVANFDGALQATATQLEPYEAELKERQAKGEE